jgi:hypothetical protein
MAVNACKRCAPFNRPHLTATGRVVPGVVKQPCARERFGRVSGAAVALALL